MNFLIFRNFLDFAEFIFYFKSIKTIKIRAKSGLFSRGTHVDAMWHARPRGRAKQAHTAPTRRDVTCALFIYIVSITFIVHISLPIIGNTLSLLFRRIL